MILSNFPPIILRPPTSSPSFYQLQYFPKSTHPRPRIRRKPNKFGVFTPISAAFSGPYVLQLAETLEDALPSASCPPFQKLRDSSSESLLSTPWPSRKDEPFRFTDTSFLKNSKIIPIESPPHQDLTSLVDSTETLLPNLSIVDGFVVKSPSLLSDLPNVVYVGGLSSLDSEAILLKRVSEYVSSFQGDMFWSLNGVGAPDLILVHVPEGRRVEKPLHLRYFAVGGSEKESKNIPISNPRVLVLVEKGGEIGIIE